MDTVTASYSGGLLSNDAYAEERTNRKGEPDSKWYIWARNLRTFHRVWPNVFLFFFFIVFWNHFIFHFNFNIHIYFLVILLYCWLLTEYIEHGSWTFILNSLSGNGIKFMGYCHFMYQGPSLSRSILHSCLYPSVQLLQKLFFEHVTACLKG